MGTFFAPNTGIQIELQGGEGVPPEEPIYWFNMRNTQAGPVGFVGDGPNSTYSTGLIHPENTIGGLTGGWVAATGAGIMVNTAGFGAYEHQAGRAPLNAGTDTRTFRISGLSIGVTYRVFLSMGAPGTTVNTQIGIYSDNRVTSLYNTPNVSVPDGSIADAQGTIFTPHTGWTAGQVGVDIVATTTSFYFARVVGTTGQINAIGIQAQ